MSLTMECKVNPLKEHLEAECMCDTAVTGIVGTFAVCMCTVGDRFVQPSNTGFIYVGH